MLVSGAVDAIEWACVLCGCLIQNELVEQWVYIKFCVKLEHSSAETIQMIQKAAAMDSWWLAASSRLQLWTAGDWQLHHDSVPTHASRLVQSFLWNITSPRWLSPPAAQIWGPVTSGFFQNWNHLWKGRYFRPSVRFRKIWWVSWWRLGELCEVPRCSLWMGLRCHCPMYTLSCILYLLE